MLRKSFLAVLATVFMLAASAASAQEAKIEGSITAINRTATPPTIRVATGGRAVVLQVTPNTFIELEDDQDGTLEDLRTGQRVKVEYDQFTGEALEIEVKDRDPDNEAEIAGTIVSATASELVLNVRGQTVVVGLDEQTRVRLNGLVLDVDDLDGLVGQRAKVLYDRDTNIAQRVKVEVPVSNLLGTVVSVDEETLALQVRGQTVLLDVPPGTPIKFRNQRLDLDDLLVGDVLKVRTLLLQPLVGILLSAEVQAPERGVTGTLSAVNGSTITILTRQGPVTLTVDERTDLRVNGLRVTLAQLGTLLTQATQAGRLIQVNAQAVNRAGVLQATRVHANVNFRGRR